MAGDRPAILRAFTDQLPLKIVSLVIAATLFVIVRSDKDAATAAYAQPRTGRSLLRHRKARSRSITRRRSPFESRDGKRASKSIPDHFSSNDTQFLVASA